MNIDFKELRETIKKWREGLHWTIEAIYFIRKYDKNFNGTLVSLEDW
jgi:hypothetical protein